MKNQHDEEPIYLDYNATTPLHPEVSKAMLPFLTQSNLFGNPSSSHIYGTRTRMLVEEARKQVASLLTCYPDEIMFTSCGSESNNLAIKGLVSKFSRESPQRNHIITCKTEHVAVIEVCKHLEQTGDAIVTYLDVDEEGFVNLEQLRGALSEKTLLVTIMHANNETGTLQPIVEIGKILDEYEQKSGVRIYLHTDASQSVGKVAFKLYSQNSSEVNFGDLVIQDLSRVDMLTVCPHKFYGPKGVGALFTRRASTQGSLQKQMHGANHENNLRAGTENVILIVGLGKSCEMATKELQERVHQMKTTRDLLHAKLLELVETKDIVRINGPADVSKRLPNTLNLTFVGIQSNTLLDEISQSIAASAGAACHSGDEYVVSYVLSAMNIPVDIALGAIRLSTGMLLSEGDIMRAARIIAEAVNRLNPRTEHIQVSSVEDVNSVRLTSMTHGLGCGCKIRPQSLEAILKNVPRSVDPNILVGTETSDDAGVYKISSEMATVSTVDFFTPMVDNPKQFGAIACANALSDVYAMGGKPLTALNIVGFPIRRLAINILQEILIGAQEKCKEAGVSIIGGHSIEDNELFFGQSITGTIHPEKIWRNIGAQAGNALMLTKPLGVGLITTALKRNAIVHSSRTAQLAVQNMSQLNKYAAEILIEKHYSVTACTDVTGFGLLGHLKEMVQSDPSISALVQSSQIPIIEGVQDLASITSLIPGGTLNNMQYVESIVKYSNEVSEATKVILCDAQTSGGLLFAIPEEQVEQLLRDFEEQNVFVRRIGSITSYAGNTKQIQVVT